MFYVLYPAFLLRIPMLTRCTNKRLDVVKIHSFQGLSQNGAYSEAWWNVRSLRKHCLLTRVEWNLRRSTISRKGSPDPTRSSTGSTTPPLSDVSKTSFRDRTFLPCFHRSVKRGRHFEKLRDSLKNSMPLRTSNKASLLLCQVFSSFLISFARIHPRLLLG